MNITREKYDEDIRKAKAQALRDAAHDVEAGHLGDDAWEIADGIRANADKVTP